MPEIEEGQYLVTERMTYSMPGTRRVSEAKKLFNKLPIGWKLLSFEWVDGWWIAVVESEQKLGSRCR